MKLLSVLLLAGIAFGQTKLVDSPKNEHISYSSKIVFVGPHESKCSVKSWDNTDLVWDSPKGTFPLMCKVDATGTGFFCKVAPKPEPLEVPAIRGKKVTSIEILSSPRVLDSGGWWLTGAEPKCDGQWYNVTPTYSECRVESWTCADKSRILEHSEENPPKYWCRKVQLQQGEK